MQKNFSYKIDGRNLDKDEIFNEIMKSRGIKDYTSFIYPQKEDMIPLENLKNINDAYLIIDEACQFGDKICILADVDVDGLSSCGILSRYFKACGAKIDVTIGQGKQHGTSGTDIDMFSNYDLLIIVDSIDDDCKNYKKIIDNGTKIVIFDHHIIPEAISSSNLPFTLVSSANEYENPQLSGAGVCMKFALYMDYMNDTTYAQNLWCYAAMGIVSDMCDMSVPENRYIVSQGLNQYNEKIVKSMIGTYPFDSTSISFSIAPLINAAMRTGYNMDALRLFISDDEEEIEEYVSILQKCKAYQNALIDEIMPDIQDQIDRQSDRNCLFLIVGNPYRDMTGLLGNKIMGQYKKPVFVLVDNELDGYSGSMRSIGVGNFLEMCNKTRMCLCMGHEEASGIYISYEDFEDFLNIINEEIEKNGQFIDVDADILMKADQIDDEFIKKCFIFNRISGNACSSINVMIKTDDYDVGYMSMGKHTKITDNETGMLFISWNDKSWDSVPKDKELCAIGTVGFARYGKKNYIQMIMKDYKFE